MPVKKDDEGRRYVEAEVEVPGSPEEVWRAIATAEGISSWFMPTTSETDSEGRPTRMTTSFGPGMDAVSPISSWDPPRSYVAGGEAGSEAAHGPETVATEWIVEARDGGTCIVRVVHRWFADSDDWDGEFEGHAYGWATSFFRMLGLYLTHFAGQKCSDLQFTVFSRMPAPEMWRTITGALGVEESAGRFASTPDAPELSGAVEHIEVTDPALLGVRERAPQIVATLAAMDGEDPELLLRLDRPGPGIAYIMAMPMGDQTMVSIRLFFYGDGAESIAAAAEQEWNGWLAERFPQEASA
jgi:uncharacterized protein YndB with AHSA1/START domain